MQKILNNILNSNLSQSVFVTVVCLLAYIIGPISTYETNDDIYYHLLFSGKLLASSPTPDVLVINIVLSKFFALLYTIAPDIPWYSCFHVVLIFLSILFLNYCYSITHNADKLLMRLIISLSCTLPFLFFIQFTKTSFVFATAGYLSLYLSNSSQSISRVQNIFIQVCAVIFLVLSFCVRRDSFLLATILCSLLLLQLLIKRNTPLITSLSIMSAIIIIFNVMHVNHYGKEWQNTIVGWQKVIGPIIDYGRIDYDTNKDVFTKVGWSRNDFHFLNIWGAVDSRIYGMKQIDYIDKYAKKTTSRPDIKETIQRAVSFPAKNYILTTVGLTLILLILYRQQHSYWYMLVLPPFLFCVIFLVWQGRFPTRVSTPLIYFLPWVLIVQSAGVRKHIVSYTLSIILLSALVIPAYAQFRDFSTLTKIRLIQNQDLHSLGTLTAKEPINLIVMGGAFPFEGILPFESPNFLSGARIIWLCSMNQSPIQKKQITEAHIQDLFLSLLQDPSTYIVINPNLIVILQRYLLEHYDVKTNTAVNFTSNNFLLFKVKPYDNTSPAKNN